MLFPDPVTQYLITIEQTLLKGIQFDQVHRLQLDIETYTTPPRPASAIGTAGDRIVIVALSDRLQQSTNPWIKLASNMLCSLALQDQLRKLARRIICRR